MKLFTPNQILQSGKIVRFLSSKFGTLIRDEQSGAVLGNAFIFSFGGRVFVIGYTGTLPLRPVAIPEKKLSYWRIRLGFAAPQNPDFGDER